MEQKDDLKVKGKILYKIEDPETGEIIDQNEIENLITDIGAEKIADYIAGNTVNDFQYIAIGSDSTAPSTSDTSLGTETARSGAIAPTKPNTNEVRWTHEFTAGEGGSTINEFGMFNDSTAGDMLNRRTFPTTIDNQNYNLTVEYTLSVQAG